MNYKKHSKLFSIFLAIFIILSANETGAYVHPLNSLLVNDSSEIQLKYNNTNLLKSIPKDKKISTKIPIEISLNDVKIEIDAQVKGKSLRTLKIISPEGEIIRNYRFNENGFDDNGSQEWLTISNNLIMVSKEVYPGTWWIELDMPSQNEEKTLLSAKLIDSYMYSFVTDEEEETYNLESKKYIQEKTYNQESEKDIQEETYNEQNQIKRNDKIYDYYKTYDEAKVDIENGYIFNMDKFFSYKVMPTVTNRGYNNFVSNHNNKLKVSIKMENLLSNTDLKDIFAGNSLILFELISPEKEVVYSFIKTKEEIENNQEIEEEILIYPGKWTYRINFAYISDGINTTNLKVTLQYQNIYKDDIDWLIKNKL